MTNTHTVSSNIGRDVDASAPDPACMITGESAEILRKAVPNMFRMFRGAPTYRDEGILDISDLVDVGEDGKLQPKSE